MLWGRGVTRQHGWLQTWSADKKMMQGRNQSVRVQILAPPFSKLKK